MKNKLGVFAILGIFLVLTSVIASITQISLTWPDSGSRKQAKPGESTAYDLIVRNVGDELVGYISFEVTDLSDNTNIIPIENKCAIGNPIVVTDNTTTCQRPNITLANPKKIQINQRQASAQHPKYFKDKGASRPKGEIFIPDCV